MPFRPVDFRIADKPVNVFETYYDECRRCGRRHLIIRHTSETVNLKVCWECYCDLVSPDVFCVDASAPSVEPR